MCIRAQRLRTIYSCYLSGGVSDGAAAMAMATNHEYRSYFSQTEPTVLV